MLRKPKYLINFLDKHIRLSKYIPFNYIHIEEELTYKETNKKYNDIILSNDEKNLKLRQLKLDSL